MLSVIICAHNPRREYLAAALAGLKAQTLSQFRWEFILVDNGSTPSLGELDLSWHQKARCVREPELGLTQARRRGIHESVGSFLVFADDDNVLAPDYLERLEAIREEYPHLGCIGAGVITPVFEVPPDFLLTPYLHILALRCESAPSWSNNPADQITPWGAGLAVSRGVAEGFCQGLDDPLRALLGRKGASLVSGEDNEFSWVACQKGLGKGIFPDLRLQHLIGRSRLDRGYLLRLTEGQAFSDTILGYLHNLPAYEKPAPTLKDVARHVLRGRMTATIESAYLWSRARNRSAIDREFEAARSRGAMRAYEFLDSQGLHYRA